MDNKKNIVVLQGSPRKNGNTEMLADAFIEGAQKAGHRVAKFNVAKMKIHGCIGCHVCTDNGGICCQKDDMQEIYPKIYECDILVLASPVYFFSYSGQIKNSIDRLETLTGRPLPITASILLTTYYQDPMSGTLEPLVAQYQKIASYLGWEDLGIVATPHMDLVGDIKGHETLEEARKLGASI